jgi:short-subunit dehydrogenase
MNTNFSVSLVNRTGNYLSRISILNPEQVAPIVIEKMLKGKEVIIPGAVNRFSMILDKLLPSFIKKILIGKLANTLEPVPFPNPNIHRDSSPQAA